MTTAQQDWLDDPCASRSALLALQSKAPIEGFVDGAYSLAQARPEPRNPLG